MLPVWILLLDVEERNKLEILFKEYADQMRAIAGTILTKREDIEDAVGDAFEHIANNMDKLEDRDLRDVHAFCVVVTRNAAKDIRRKNNKYRSVFTEINEDITPEPTDIFERFELAEIKRCVLKLPEELKEVLYLYYFIGISVKGIADIQRVKPITVYKRIGRGHQVLRKMLEAGDIDAD